MNAALDCRRRFLPLLDPLNPCIKIIKPQSHLRMWSKNAERGAFNKPLPEALMKRARGLKALILMTASWGLSMAAEGPRLPQMEGPLDQVPPASPEGAAIWTQRCSSCHDHPVDRIPPHVFLQFFRSPEQVVLALTKGPMVPQAQGLSEQQIRQVATYLTGRPPGAIVDIDPNANLCKKAAPRMQLGPQDWPDWGIDLNNSRFQRDPGFAAKDVPRLKVKWVFAYPPGQVDGQPTVTSGRLFVAHRSGRIFSLDAKTGCTYWSYQAKGGLRGAVVVGALPHRAANDDRFAAYFATEDGHVEALDAEKGTPLWSTSVGNHPLIRLTGSPILYRDRVFVGISTQEELASHNRDYPCCTSRGAIVALDAVTGDMIWTAYTIDEPKPIGTSAIGTPKFGPAGATVWTTPTIDAKRNLVYANTGNSFTQVSVPTSNAVIAFDLKTGERRWVSQILAADNYCSDTPEKCPRTGPDVDMIGSPMLLTLSGGRQIVVATLKTGESFGFDPDQHGKMIWHHAPQLPLGSREAGWGFASDGTQYFQNGWGISALDTVNGKELWFTKAPAPACSWKAVEIGGAMALFGDNQCTSRSSAALVLIPGAIFDGALDGHVRAYRTTDGELTWDFDTGRTWQAVNGANATGGSINFGAQAIADGMLYVNSGAGGLNQPGNALIAFSVDGK
jgi:polyvinyl alcohol dehydrogenase (cytochrome)